MANFLPRVLVYSQLILCTSAFAFQGAGDLFIDANSTLLDREGQKQSFKGDVVAIGPSIIISADEIAVDNARKELHANGHVLLVSGAYVYSGTDVVYNFSSGDFVLKDAMMILNDLKKSSQHIDRLLGFSIQELEFEKSRSEALTRIQKEKAQLQKQAIIEVKESELPSMELTERFRVLLEQEQIIKARKNPHTEQQKALKGARIESRRKFWTEQRQKKLALIGASPVSASFYFTLSGSELIRVNDNDYTANDALWTPCFCEEDEAPAWAFRSRSAFAQTGGYITMKHSLLEVKGVPILYIPYLKIPLKSERQSGFLLPYLSDDSESGAIFSQPVFLALDEHYDATFKFDFFQKRGFKLGGEFRIEQASNSGWLLNLQGIRDKKWIEDRADRDELSTYFLNGLDASQGEIDSGSPAPSLEGLQGKDYFRERLKQSDYWQSRNMEQFWGKEASATAQLCLEPGGENLEYCKETIRNLLKTPDNNMRSAAHWRGQTFLTPRFSIVSQGELLSDHRVPQDLYLENEAQILNKSQFTDLLFGSDELAQTYSKTKLQLHFDNPNFYAGLGNSFSDSFNLEKRFEGQQIPAQLKIETRYFDLFPGQEIFKIYGKAGFSQIRIHDFEGNIVPDLLQADVELPQRPGEGSWQNYNMGFISPLITDSFFVMNYFANLEARQVRFKDDGGVSTINTWNNGFRFSLPIDGKIEIQKNESNIDDPSVEGLNAQRYLNHTVDFILDLSWRPSVVKEGAYDQLSQDDGEFAYFSKDLVDPQQLAMFRIKQTWGTAQGSWNTKLATAKVQNENVNMDAANKEEAKSEKMEDADSLQEIDSDRVMRELLLLNDEAVKDTNIFSGSGKESYTTYSFIEGRSSQFADLQFDISYDYYKEQQRREAEKLNDSDAVEKNFPWSNFLSEGWMIFESWRLKNSVSYNISDKFTEYTEFGLNLPPIFSSTFGLNYRINKERITERSKVSGFRQTRDFGGILGSTYFDNYYAEIKANRKISDAGQINDTGFKLAYSNPSKCWGLEFERTESLHYEYGRQPRYYVRLRVDFMGRSIAKDATPRTYARRIPNAEEQYD